jgi:hypothetical protein
MCVSTISGFRQWSARGIVKISKSGVDEEEDKLAYMYLYSPKASSVTGVIE